MNKINPSIKIGITYTIGLFLLIYGIFFLKKTDIFKNNYNIYAYFNTANGLGLGDPVILNGLKIGKVTELLIDKQTVKAKFEVLKNIRLPKDTKAGIVSQSLIGGKTLELSWGNSLEYIENNDTIGTIPVANMSKMFSNYSGDILSKIVPIEDKLNLLLDKLSLSTDQLQESILLVNRILSKNEQNINKIFGNIDQILHLVNQNTLPLIHESLAEIRDFGKQINSTQTKEIFTAFHKTSQNLAELTGNMNGSKNTINSLFTSNELHQKILDLLTDLKKNPERYIKISVFGKESPEVKYKNKMAEIEMKKKWQEYQSEQKK